MIRIPLYSFVGALLRPEVMVTGSARFAENNLTVMHIRPILLTAISAISAATALLASLASSAEQRVSSPDGKLTLVVSDDAGLRYRVELDGKPLLADSVLGLAFADGTTLGPAAKIADTQTATRNNTWDNPIGQRRTVPDRFRELRLNLREGGGGMAARCKSILAARLTP